MIFNYIISMKFKEKIILLKKKIINKNKKNNKDIQINPNLLDEYDFIMKDNVNIVFSTYITPLSMNHIIIYDNNLWDRILD